MDAIQLFDRLPVSGLRQDNAGNLIGVARAARTGIQEYAGYEVGRPDLAKVRVYRPPEEVFHRDSMRTFAAAPVTIEHPGRPVTPDNWRDHAVGETASDDIVRDGETVKVPFIIRDSAGQQAIADGKHQVSMGYSSMIDFTAGTVPDGQPDAGQAYDAIQRNIRINHLAIVDAARGGPTLRIGDSETGTGVREMATKMMIVDGLQVEVTDAAEAAINKLQGQITAKDAALAEANTKLLDAEKERDELQGKVTALEQQVKDATNPANLAKAAAARATLVDQAKKLVPSIVTDGKDDAAIRKEVVEAKLGDAAKGLTNDGMIDGAFASLAAGIPATGKGSGTDDVAAIIRDGTTTNLDDAREARNKALQARNDRFAGRKTEDA